MIERVLFGRGLAEIGVHKNNCKRIEKKGR